MQTQCTSLCACVQSVRAQVYHVTATCHICGFSCSWAAQHRQGLVQEAAQEAAQEYKHLTLGGGAKSMHG